MDNIQVINYGVVKDKFGVKLKFPTRSCKQCKRYPCFPEINKCSCDFAMYGCIDWVDKYKKSSKRKNKRL